MYEIDTAGVSKENEQGNKHMVNTHVNNSFKIYV